MRLVYIVLALISLSAYLVRADDLTLSLTEKGISIKVPNAGQVTWTQPILLKHEKGNDVEKPQVTLQPDGTAEAKYASGVTLTISLDQATKSVTYVMSRIPSEAHAFLFNLVIPSDLPAKCAFDDESPVELPATFNVQDVIKGHQMSRFSLIGTSGGGLAVEVPRSWASVQDNRQANWNTFTFQYQYPFVSFQSQTAVTIQFEPLAGPAPSPASP